MSNPSPETSAELQPSKRAPETIRPRRHRLAAAGAVTMAAGLVALGLSRGGSPDQITDPPIDPFQSTAEEVAAEVLAACQLETSTCTDSRQPEGRVITFRGDGSGLPGDIENRVTGSYHATVTIGPPFTSPREVTSIELGENDYPDWGTTGQRRINSSLGWHKWDDGSDKWTITRQVSGPEIQRGFCLWFSQRIDEQTTDDLVAQMPDIWKRMPPKPGKSFGERITPWPVADPTCRQAYTDHLDGTFERPQPIDN